MRRSVENAETVGMRRGNHTSRPSRARLARLATSPIPFPSRQVRIIFDPLARVPTLEPETSPGPFEFTLTIPGTQCCHCPVTSSYLYGVTHCPDCGGRRSTNRINFNRVPARHLHKFHCVD